jgi:D-alanine transaminase
MTTPDLPSHPCYLNGVYTPLNEAKVSVLDRGFIFGDGVYEVLPVYGGRVFRFAQHMARLERSLAELRLNGWKLLHIWELLTLVLRALAAKIA